ncbi:5'-nucleotidase C-terminal domain-containing protein [Methylocystis sp. IM3]|uniref:bifunctional metallophosphatase/5'-nucleotidase n=1 Tax=Methylocystis sp. IM3 TaxID=3136722 RepID=UPI00311A54E0
MRRILAAVLLLLALAGWARASERTAHLTLIVFSDIYEMDERNGRGGFARVSGALKAERAKAQNTLVAFAGDTLSPSLLSSLDKGAHIVELFNLIGVDVFTPGNHEFDFGEDIFRSRMGDLQATRLAANLRDGAGNLMPGFADSRIIEMDGVRLGVFGLTEDESDKRSNTGTLRIAPAIETARRESRKLREAGADLIVAVTHSEWKDDLRLAKTGLVDVILSGHDHNLFVAFDGRTAIAETQADGAQLVAVDLAISISDAPARKVTWTPRFRILDTADAAPDPAVAARAVEIRARLDKGLDEPIGATRTELDGRKASVRTRETALGDFLADAMREAAGADVAILNGGAIRGDAVLASGATLTRKSVLAALPFANRLVTLELSGADLRAVLESAYGALGKDAGRFAQISGARLRLRGDAVPGSRLSSIEAAGAPLDEMRLYKVATNDYLASGKDGYDAFLRAKPLVSGDAAPLVSAVVIEAIRRAGAIAPRTDGRITIE